MDHIENRPVYEAKPSIPVPVPVVGLSDPNVINKMTPWTLSFRQLEPGAMRTNVRLKSCGDLSIIEIEMDRKTHQTGQAPPGTVTFGIPLGHGIDRWGGVEAGRGATLGFGSNEGFDGVSNARFHGLTFTINQERMIELGDALGLSAYEQLQCCGVFPTIDNPAKIVRLEHFGRSLLNGNIADAEEVMIGESIIHLVLMATADTKQVRDKSRPSTRRRALTVALEMMEEHPDEFLPISLICKETGVSARTLSRAFVEKFGIGPKSYHARLRLGALRRELLNDETEESISDIANRFGYWHVGQLAKDYRAFFGELPSRSRTLGAVRSTT